MIPTHKHPDTVDFYESEFVCFDDPHMQTSQIQLSLKLGVD